MSESWERENKPLDQLINLEDFRIISNIHQRRGVGGRPAIFVNEKLFTVTNLTNTEVSIPWGVEIVWAVLTPRKATNASKIQKIVVASIYCKPGSKKKTILLDHIAQVYSQLSAKYKKGLHWILCGDTNDLRLEPILMLNGNLKQVVKQVTRLNPPRILDPIITTLSTFYQDPRCLPPLDPDPDCNGKPSDHKMVVMEPISVLNNRPAREKKKITFRAITELGLQKMQLWLENETWDEETSERCAHKKAELLQKKLVRKYNEFFPEKSRMISSDSQPFFTNKLMQLKRKKSREYVKHRRSDKWKQLNSLYHQELSKAKKNFYRKKIQVLRKSKPGKWYSALKKLTSFDQQFSENIEVESIKDLPDKEQADKIVNKFAEVSQEYEQLNANDIEIPTFSENEIPQFTEYEVRSILNQIDENKSNVTDDFPAKLFKKFGRFLAKPIQNLINCSIKQGKWPDIFKIEIVTPIPKEYPVKDIDQLRNISGLKNLDKIAEKLISKLIISDMKQKLDPTQYANQKGLSIQHYLIGFIDRILAALDNSSKNQKCAVLATLVDWKQAFPRQCPRLGIESFLKNGVRPSLIPVLINFFQGRRMKVKWHGKMSSEKELKGGGPQGSTFGLWEYLSQSNDNAECIDEEDRFKFVDDLSFLEIIFLLSCGIASYNLRTHIPSDIPSHNQIIKKENLKSQEHLENINKWTKEKKMKLNEKKTKNMIFNFSKNNQFTTKLNVNDIDIEVVKETKLLGTIITDRLTWDRNSEELIKKGFKRMSLLVKAATFTTSKMDLKNIYLTFIRSIIEQSAVVWHSSLTKRNRSDIERVQKAAIKVIMGKSYTTYKNGLEYLNLDTLDQRREKLCLKFAKQCLKTEKVKKFFPLENTKHVMKTSKKRTFKIFKQNTKRYQNSAIPFMRKLLNNEYERKSKIIGNIVV